MSDALRVWQWLVGVLFDKSPNGPPVEVGLPPSDAAWWRNLISAANASLVSALFWERLRQRPELAARIPDDEREYLVALHELTSARNAAILDQLSAILSAFAAEGIESLPLKGAAYLLEAIDGAGVRHLSDIDLLVPASEAERAREVLLRDGYEDAPVTLRAGRDHHHLTPMVHRSLPAAIELHTEVVPRFLAAALTASEVWSRARRGPGDGPSAPLPCPTDAAAISFLHAELVDLGTTLWLIPLRPFCDLAMLNAAWGNGIDWIEIGQRAKRVGGERHLRRYAYFHERLSGERLFPATKRSLGNWLSYRISVAAIDRPGIIRWRLRAHRLSVGQLRRKYGTDESRLAIGLARTAEVARMLRNAVSGDRP